MGSASGPSVLFSLLHVLAFATHALYPGPFTKLQSLEVKVIKWTD